MQQRIDGFAGVQRREAFDLLGRPAEARPSQQVRGITPRERPLVAFECAGIERTGGPEADLRIGRRIGLEAHRIINILPERREAPKSG
jgi:hypothetical protein